MDNRDFDPAGDPLDNVNFKLKKKILPLKKLDNFVTLTIFFLVYAQT